jgi:hypothetical protein
MYFKPAGINNYDTHGITIWPNPTNGIVNIDLSGGLHSEYELSVEDVLGRTLITQHLSVDGGVHYVIDLAPYPAGCYFITLKTAGSIMQYKIILN